MNRRDFQLASFAAGLAMAAPGPLLAQSTPKKRVIVDAQIHLWKANTPDRPWAPGALAAQLPEPMTIERVLPLLDSAGVDKLVIVPPTLEGLRYDYGQEAARRYPGRFATMARVDLTNPNEAARIAALREQPAVLGIRVWTPPPVQSKWLEDGTADWFWPVAEKAGLPVMFLTVGQTPIYGRIAERHPQLRLIIDHMGVTDYALKDDTVQQRVDEAAALARYPNVSVKLSSVPLFSKQAYPWRDTFPLVRKLFDSFGPARCHWGSDLTNTYNLGPYRQRVTQFTEEMPFTEDEKDWVMGKSILQVLRWS